VFLLVRRLTRGALGLGLAVVGAALATLTLPALREASLVSGTVLGALLVLAPVALAAARAPMAIVAATVGLAASYDVPVFAASALGVATLLLLSGRRPSATSLLGAALGIAPVAWMAWRRVAAPDASLDVPLWSSFVGEGARSVPQSAAITIARAELGVVALGCALVGAGVALRSRVTRPLAASLVAIVAAGALSPLVGAPAGPVRFGGALLAGLAATSVLAATGMSAVVTFVAKAKVPLARASAAMIALLELAVPVRVADDASLALAKTRTNTTARWNASVFGDLPRNAVVLVPNARLFLRARAAAASGAVRDDVIVLPTWGLGARATGHAIAREPLLAPLVRDLALYGAPEEFSLSQLAAVRPLLVAFDARWDKRFARHLVPQGAFDRYFVEPRGGAERMKAFGAVEEPTLRALRSDPPLFDATRELVAARASAAKVTGERDYDAAATAELLRFGRSPL
jgi:hypothetical protein